MRRITALLVSLITPAIVVAQSKQQDFVIDPSKPYVYLQFDHVGPRKPIQSGEPSTGIWLRIVNNCRVPIAIGAFGVTTGDVGIGVLDEVVPIGSGGARVEAEDATVPTVAIPPNPGTDEPKSMTTKPTIPEGYSAEIRSMYPIAPGESVLFSVPISHVSPAWFMRVRFTLAVNKPQVGGLPYSYVDFSESDIPLKHRGSKEAGTIPTSAHPLSPM